MSIAKGKEAEDKASSFLEANGYIILDKNFHSKFGEIDIIAQKENILHFCEVKFSEKYDPVDYYRDGNKNLVDLILKKERFAFEL